MLIANCRSAGINAGDISAVQFAISCGMLPPGSSAEGIVAGMYARTHKHTKTQIYAADYAAFMPINMNSTLDSDRLMVPGIVCRKQY